MFVHTCWLNMASCPQNMSSDFPSLNLVNTITIAVEVHAVLMPWSEGKCKHYRLSLLSCLEVFAKYFLWNTRVYTNNLRQLPKLMDHRESIHLRRWWYHPQFLRKEGGKSRSQHSKSSMRKIVTGPQVNCSVRVSIVYYTLFIFVRVKGVQHGLLASSCVNSF